MPDHVLERRFWVPRSRVEAFAFFADPLNLGRVQPPRVRLEWLVPPPAVLEAGAVLDFAVRVGRLATRWRVIVREWDPPYRFVDALLRGPFARWEHRHRFMDGPAHPDPPGPGGTWVEDRVTYRLPLGPAGELAHAVAAGRWIAAAFAHRERRARELLAAP